MANNYYQATGRLKLNEITPVIKALFGVLSVQKDDSGAYIAIDSFECNSTYGHAAKEIISTMDIECDEENFGECVLMMADKLKIPLSEEMKEFIESIDESYCYDDVDPEAIFRIAAAIDDGHGLESGWLSGAWTCDKLRVGEFGGDSVAFSKNGCVRANTNMVPD